MCSPVAQSDPGHSALRRLEIYAQVRKGPLAGPSQHHFERVAQEQRGEGGRRAAKARLSPSSWQLAGLRP